MAVHYTLKEDERALALKLAQKALRSAQSQQTAAGGDIYIPNYDEDGFRDGTGTYIGSGSIGNGGVAQWVGDTTPPGEPTGVSASSTWGVVYAKWDGALDGGVPDDFAYVSVTIDGTEVGKLAEAGTVATDGYADGQEVAVGFTAYDSARDRDGSLSPNASDTATVSVTVSDDRDQIDADVAAAEEKADAAQQAAQEAKDKADELADSVEESVQTAVDAAERAQGVADDLSGQLTGITTTVNGVEQSVEELTATVSGVAETADGALTAATEAKQTATEVSTTATQALETASDALTQSTEAKQTADSISATLETDYVSKADAEETYATKTELEATSDGLTASITEAAETADSALSKATEVEATADSISATIASDYLSKADAEETYATQSSVEQTAESIRSEVSEAASTADSALTAATTAQQTADSFSQTATQALETADEALAQATTAQQTVDSFKTTVSETYATKDELDDSIAQEVLDRNSAIEQSADEITTTVSETYQLKGDYLTAEDAEVTYATQSSVTQTADSILSEVSTTYVSQEDADATYATKTYVDQQDDSITSTVSAAASTADSALEKASTVEQTVDGLEVRLTEAESAASEAQAAADDAAKTATNYLGFSSDGLVVGTNSSGDGQTNLQGNVRLTSGGMEVRDGDTVLASYGANEISLGQNSEDSVVKMCGGAAEIYYSASAKQIGIVPASDLVSDGSVAILAGGSGSDMGICVRMREYSDGSEASETYISTERISFADYEVFDTSEVAYALAAIKKPGETMTAVGFYGGYITNSGTSLRFSIPCTYATDVEGAEASGSWGLYARADGGYEVGSSSSATSISASAISITPRAYQHLDVSITFSTARTNNIAVGVQVSSGSISFS